MREAQALAYWGDFRTTKTTQHLQRHFHWPSMHPQVEKFMRVYALCSQSKPSNRKHRLYQPLPLTSRPWESIWMDFLSGLPTTQNKHDVIWVVVCRFSKMALFVPCTKTTTTAQTTKLYFHHVWPHFGVPSSIISDRDYRYLSMLVDHMGAIWVPPQVLYCIPLSSTWPNIGCQHSLRACSSNSLWAHQTIGQLLTHSPT